MYYFYPLPVTPNYMRLKKKKTEDSTTLEKLNEIAEAVPDFKSEERKYGLWTISAWWDQRTFKTKEEVVTANLLSQQEISIFDSSDSKIHSSKLKTFFDQYLPQTTLKRKILAIENKMLDYDLECILQLYKQFGTCCICLNNELSTEDAFRNCLLKDIYTPKQKLFEPYKADSHLCKTEYRICSDSRWLHLMSWWKMLNENLNDFTEDMAEIVQQQTLQIETKVSQIYRVELIEKIDNLLRKLRTSESSLEVIALESYVSIKKPKPTAGWPISWSQGQIFIHNLNQDYKRMIFVKECSYHVLKLIFNVMETLEIHFEEPSLKKEVELVLTENLEGLYFILHTMDDKVTYRDFVKPLVETTKNELNELIDKFCTYHCKNVIIPPSASSNLVLKSLHGIIEAVAKCGCIGKYDEMNTFDLITNNAFEIIKNGIMLSEMTFQKQFLSEELLLNIAKQEPDLPAKMFIIKSAQMAYAFVTAHKIMSRSREYHMLPYSYTYHDFLSFLMSINRYSDFHLPKTNDISFQYSLNIRTITDNLLKELNEGMGNRACSIDRLKVLLYQCRYTVKS